MLKEETDNNHQPLRSYVTQNLHNREQRFVISPEGNLLLQQSWVTYIPLIKEILQIEGPSVKA